MFSDMELHRSNRAPPLKIFPHLFTRLVRPDLEIAKRRIGTTGRRGMRKNKQ